MNNECEGARTLPLPPGERPIRSDQSRVVVAAIKMRLAGMSKPSTLDLERQHRRYRRRSGRG